VTKLKAMKKEECAAEVVALAATSVEDAAVVLPSLKPGYARAALAALTPDVVGLVLAAMDADEIATSLSAMVRVGAPIVVTTLPDLHPTHRMPTRLRA
jgi:hypothetical protein